MKPATEFELVLRGAQPLAHGTDLEALLTYLRSEGLSPIESVKALKQLRGDTLAEAKEAVHYSHTWSDLRPHQEKLHREILNALAADPDLSFSEPTEEGNEDPRDQPPSDNQGVGLRTPTG